SLALRTLIGLTCTLSEGARAWIALNWAIPAALACSRITAARVVRGAICFSSSSHFPLKSRRCLRHAGCDGNPTGHTSRADRVHVSNSAAYLRAAAALPAYQR